MFTSAVLKPGAYITHSATQTPTVGSQITMSYAGNR